MILLSGGFPSEILKEIHERMNTRTSTILGGVSEINFKEIRGQDSR